jgi:hypothetical protein
VSGTVTASSYTGCHGHDGGDTFVFPSTIQLSHRLTCTRYCNAPGGGEVKVVLAAATPAGAAVTQQPNPEGSPTSSLTAISDCHLHEGSMCVLLGTYPVGLLANLSW